MTTIDYIGFDVHKKTISFCAKAQDGRILEEGTIPARRVELSRWAQARPRPWVGALEASANEASVGEEQRTTPFVLDKYLS